MSHFRLFPLSVLAGAALLASCTAESTGGAEAVATPPPAGAAPVASARDELTPEPWIAKGRVIDPAGAPMAGVEVRASHTMLYNSHLYDTTGPDGRFRIELSGIQPSSWRVGSAIEREFEGARYVLPLHVDTHAGFPGRDGAVRQLQWRLSGDDGNGAYHGATGHVRQSGSIVNGRQMVVKLEPVELIDGSRGGEPVTLAVDGDVIRGVPIGRHRVSVQYQPPNGRRRQFKLRDADREADGFAPVVELSVRPDRYGYPSLPIEVQVPDGEEWID